GDTDHREHPEYAKDQLSVITGDFKAKGHSRIFRIMKLKPVAKNRNFISVKPKRFVHIMVSGKLYNLIQQDYSQAQKIEFRVFHLYIKKSKWGQAAIDSGPPIYKRLSFTDS